MNGPETVLVSVRWEGPFNDDITDPILRDMVPDFAHVLLPLLSFGSIDARLSTLAPGFCESVLRRNTRVIETARSILLRQSRVTGLTSRSCLLRRASSLPTWPTSGLRYPPLLAVCVTHAVACTPAARKHVNEWGGHAGTGVTREPTSALVPSLWRLRKPHSRIATRNSRIDVIPSFTGVFVDKFETGFGILVNIWSNVIFLSSGAIRALYTWCLWRCWKSIKKLKLSKVKIIFIWNYMVRSFSDHLY